MIELFFLFLFMVSSTKASSVIPALADIYDNFGNPDTQLSDNGTSFNSSAMEGFYTREIHENYE